MWDLMKAGSMKEAEVGTASFEPPRRTSNQEKLLEVAAMGGQVGAEGHPAPQASRELPGSTLESTPGHLLCS